MRTILTLFILCLTGSGVLVAQETSSAAQKRGAAAFEEKKFDDAITSFSEAIRLDPQNAGAFNSRGLAKEQKALATQMSETLLEAYADFDRAIELDPNQTEYYLNRGRVRGSDRPSAISGAVNDYSKAIEIDPDLAEAFVQRGGVYWIKGLTTYHRGNKPEAQDDYDLAIADFDKAIQLDSKLADAYAGRGSVRFSMREFKEAREDFSDAIRLSPDKLLYILNRANIFAIEKNIDKAIQDYSHAIRLAPERQSTYYSRGVLFVESGQYARAIEDFTEAIRLDPQDFRALNRRAKIYATCSDCRFRDGKKAVADASKACELTGNKFPAYFDVLAAAHAEAGDFEKAITTVTKAMELESDTKLLLEYQKHLSLYRRGFPFHEPAKE